MLGLQGEREVARRQARVGGQHQQPLTQDAQRDLRVRTLEHGAGQAQQHITAALVAGQAARRVFEVRQIGRPLVQAGSVAFDLQCPAGLARKPHAQFVGMAPHRRELGMRRRHQWRHQQGAQRSADLVGPVARLLPADAAGVVGHGIASASVGVMQIR